MQVQPKSALAKINGNVVACRRCPELRAYCESIALTRKKAFAEHEYWGKPVPSFGDEGAKVMLVGLAPGAHGSNRTGRMFTGDASGDFLYPALYRAGFASQPYATHLDDGMTLSHCIISSAARCAPPGNKPTRKELENCLSHLAAEFEALPSLRVIVGLGAVGFEAAIKVLKLRGFTFAPGVRLTFKHGAEYEAGKAARNVILIGSYHPSRQNTNTGLLTSAMMDAVLSRAADLRGN